MSAPLSPLRLFASCPILVTAHSNIILLRNGVFVDIEVPSKQSLMFTNGEQLD